MAVPDRQSHRRRKSSVSDQHAQLKQLREHATAIRIDFHAAEIAGAAVPAIHDAKELLEAAVKKAEEAITQGAC